MRPSDTPQGLANSTIAFSDVRPRGNPRLPWAVVALAMFAAAVMVLPASSLTVGGSVVRGVPIPWLSDHGGRTPLEGLYLPTGLQLGSPLSPGQNVAGSLTFSTSDSAGLQRVLAAQSDPASPLYHQYLQGDEYDELFGPSTSQQSALANYLAEHQIVVTEVSPFLWNLRGSAAAMNSAFATTFVSAVGATGHSGYAPRTTMSLPSALAAGVRAAGAFQSAVSQAHSDRVAFSLPSWAHPAKPRVRSAGVDNLTVNITNPFMTYVYASYGVALDWAPTASNQTYTVEMFNGTPPYQVNIVWGDGSVENYVTSSPYLSLFHNYYFPAQQPYSGQSQGYNITLTVTDANGTVVSPTLVPVVIPGVSPMEDQLYYDESPLLSQGVSGKGTSVGIDDMCDTSYPTAQYILDLNQFSAAFNLPQVKNGTTFDIVGSGNNDWTCANNGGGSPGWSGETLLDIEAVHSLAPNATIVLDLSASAIDEGDELFDSLSNGVFIDSNSWGCSYNNSASGCDYTAQPWNQAVAQGQSFLVASGDCGAPGMAGGFDPPTDSPSATGVGGTAVIPYPSGVFQSEFAWNSTEDSSCDSTGANDDGSTGGYASNVGGWNASAIPAPWYQTKMTGFSGSYRGVPDVAAIGGTWFMNVYDGGWSVSAGTSLASPSWAAMLDLMYDFNATATRANGFANYDLYLIAEGANYDTAFHDVVVGTNFDTGWNFGYSTTVGWDPVTGLGSPDVGKLAMFLAKQNKNSAPIGPLSVVLAANVTDVPAGSAVNFGADATGGAPTLAGYSYTWTFGDGTTPPVTTAYQTTHIYTVPGNYAATVSVTVGSNTQVSNTVHVHVSGPVPFEVFADASPLSGIAPLTVDFDAAYAGWITGTVTAWSWHFGDGATASTQLASHQYTSGGTYTAWVNATDSASQTAESAALTIVVAPPLAITASANVTSGSAPLAVAFSSVPSGGSGSYTGYSWHFGDGTLGVAQNPDHTYGSQGTYSAWVNVTDTRGVTAESNVITLTVSPAVPALDITSFGAAPSSIEIGDSTTFTVVASGGTQPYHYSYTDLPAGCTSSNVATFTCTPTSTGSSTVTVTVTDHSSPMKTATLSTSLTVTPPPLTVSISGPTTVPATATWASYWASTTGGTPPYKSYSWSFSDDSSAIPTTSNWTSYTFPSSGTVTIVVTVYDSAGASAKSSALTVTVTAAPSSTSSTTSGTLLGQPLYVWALIAVAVIVVIALIAVASRKKKEVPPPNAAGAWSGGATAFSAPTPPPGESSMEPPPSGATGSTGWSNPPPPPGN